MSTAATLESTQVATSMPAMLWAQDLGESTTRAAQGLLRRHQALEVRYRQAEPADLQRFAQASRAASGALRLQAITGLIGDVAAMNGSSLFFRAEDLQSRLGILLAGQLLPWLDRAHGLRALAHPVPLRLYLEKAIKLSLMDFAQLLARAEHHLNRHGAETAHYVLPDQPVRTPALVAELARIGLRLPDPDPAREPGLLTLARDLALVGDLVGQLGPDRAAQGDPARDRLGVLYTEGLLPDRQTDMFWYPEGETPGDQVLVILDQKNLVPDEAEVAYLRTQAMAVFTQHPEVAHAVGVEPGATTPLLSRTTGPLALARRLAQAVALRRQGLAELFHWSLNLQTRLCKQLNHWRQVLDAHPCTLISYPSISDINYLALHAVARGRGIPFFARQRSFHWQRATHSWLAENHGQAHFVWGRQVVDYLDGGRGGIEHFIVTGLTYGDIARRHAARSADLRRELKTPDTRFLLCLLDNTFGDFFMTPNLVAEFYEALLDWLERDPGLRIVIKSKRPGFLAQLEEVWKRLDRVETQTGRLRWLDPRLYPAEAALACDFTVGVGISTPVFEAAICGVRGICCDQSRYLDSDLYAWGRGRVIFDRLDQGVAALEAYSHHPEANPDLGDFGPILDQLDPFRDGRGGQRAGQFLAWVHRAKRRGASGDQALAEAEARYAQAWGDDKIILRPQAPQVAPLVPWSGKTG